MPLFVTPCGEGVVVHATPHRESSALKRSVRLNKLAQYCMWLSLVERGLSSADVSALVDRPLSTVKLGIARARRHMTETGERKAASQVDPLIPAFGCRRFTKARDNSFHTKGECDLCGSRRMDKHGNATQTRDNSGRVTVGIGCDGLVCPACGCVTSGVQERFNLQLDADDVRASQIAANHAEIPAAPEDHYDAEEAAQAVARVASSAGSPPPWSTPPSTCSQSRPSPGSYPRLSPRRPHERLFHPPGASADAGDRRAYLAPPDHRPGPGE